MIAGRYEVASRTRCPNPRRDLQSSLHSAPFKSGARTSYGSEKCSTLFAGLLLSNKRYGSLSRLDSDERALFAELAGDRHGLGVRLEQERIPFGWVRKALSALY
jgi:Wadjet anti plasmid transformation system JetA-like protein